MQLKVKYLCYRTVMVHVLRETLTKYTYNEFKSHQASE